MNKIYKLLILFTLVGGLTNCDIERNPYHAVPEEEVLNSEEGLQASTIGNLAYLKRYSFVKPQHFIGEFASDNVALSGTTTDRLFNLYSFNRVTDNWHVDQIWESSYLIIINCNRNIIGNETGESPEKDILLGYNHYLRGFLYFNLANTFGRPYAQDPSHLAVPIKLTADLDDYPARSTVKEVYEQAIEDLKFAAQLITKPKEGGENIYPSKEGAWAMLSRMYLYMEEWELAKNYADSVEHHGTNSFELLRGEDYKKYSQKLPEENSETIFAIKHVEDIDFPYETGWGTWSNWNTVGSMYATVNGAGWGEMYASKSLRDVLDENPSDLRHAFIDPQYSSGEWALWVDEDRTTGAGENYPMFDTQNVEKEGDMYAYYVDTNLDGTDERFEVEEIDEKYFLDDWDRVGEEMVNRGSREVEISDRMHMRNGFPKYYVLKCSLQEGQDHMWSPVISRLAEMYLNRAEAYYHLGDEDKALAEINVLRERAQIPQWDIADLPAGKTVLDLILQERRVELAFESHRKFDVFRTKRNMDRQYPGTHYWAGDPKGVISWESNDVVLKIPEQSIDKYPGDLVQNQ